MPIDEIEKKVSDRYAKAASTGEQMCCPTSYDMANLKSFIPEEVLKISYGCGTPAGLNTVSAGETVLDIGSGGGIDVLLSAKRVGPTGRAFGLDMTDEMLALARRNAAEAGAANVEFLKGQIEAIPLPAESIDVVISNCVINKREQPTRISKPGLSVSNMR